MSELNNIHIHRLSVPPPTALRRGKYLLESSLGGDDHDDHVDGDGDGVIDGVISGDGGGDSDGHFDNDDSLRMQKMWTAAAEKQVDGNGKS